jgi:hypothetical protein
VTTDPSSAFCGFAINDADGIPRFICTLPPHSGLLHENLGGRAFMVGGKWLIESGTHFDSATLPSRAQIEAHARAAWSAVRAARMDNPEAQAGYQAAAEHHHKETQS